MGLRDRNLAGAMYQSQQPHVAEGPGADRLPRCGASNRTNVRAQPFQAKGLSSPTPLTGQSLRRGSTLRR